MIETANRSRPGLAVEFLFLATVFTVSFAKLQWEVAGTLSLSDVLTGIFLVAWIGTRVGTGDRRLAWGAAVAGLFFVGFLAVYLIGFFNLETGQALDQFVKGLTKWLLHFGFLIVGVIYLAQKSLAFYWREDSTGSATTCCGRRSGPHGSDSSGRR